MLIGGIAEIVPMFTVAAGPEQLAGIEPYTPLEVGGRDIYIREGCYNCHSQMIRPFRSETLRYGEWSRAGEYAYDHPFQLGSRRIGPDLARVGGKYGDIWHFEHMKDPRSTSPKSIMPPYPWLYESSYDAADIQKSVGALQSLGVPYSEEEVSNALALIKKQADEIVARLAEKNAQVAPDKEIVALIAYLQRLGVDGKRVLGQQAQRGGQ
jgi:cytochrome c oxidase cbb3-type subunit I/II